jgi:hypothetical protein
MVQVADQSQLSGESMDRYIAALSAIGGLAAVGGFIDFMISRREQERLRDWMTNWWVRFEDVKWSNFGRKESEQALAMLDRLAGARLWSIKRWKFVGITSLGLMLLVAIVLVIGLATPFAESPDTPVRSFFDAANNYWQVTDFNIASVLIAVATCMALGLSISMFRLLAWIVVLLSPSGLIGFLFFAVLLLLQLILLLYWSSAVTELLIVPANLISNILLYDDTYFVTETLRIDIQAALRKVFAPPSMRILNLKFEVTRYFYWDRLLLQTMSPGEGWRHQAEGFKFATDLASNGLRIGFALVFLSSFVFGSVLKPFISRLWAGIIESKKPIFTMLLGGVATIYEALSSLLK